MNLLLTGASGFIGHNLTAALSAAGHHIKPICRSEGIDFSQMLSVADWLPQLKGINAVLKTLHILSMVLLFGTDWDKLPPALQAHYRFGTTTDTGRLDMAYPPFMQPLLSVLSIFGLTSYGIAV